MVTFTFEAEAGDCHPESLRLLGPRGILPVQLVQRSSWPGNEGFIKSATVAFYVNLAPGEVATYTLSFNGKPTDAIAAVSGLNVERRADVLRVVGQNFGATFRLTNETYKTPQDSSIIPGPLVNFTFAQGGRVFGGSRMYGPTKITAVESDVVATGPVFSEMRWKYTYADGNAFHLRARLGERDSAVYWDMNVAQNALDDGWHLIIGDSELDLSLRLQMEAYSIRKCFVENNSKPGDWGEVPLRDEPEGMVAWIMPWADWFDERTQAVLWLKPEHRLSLPPLVIASRDPGAWVTPLTRKISILQEVAGFGGRHTKKIECTKVAGGEISLKVNLAADPGGGLRRWTSGVMPPDVIATIPTFEQMPDPLTVARAMQLAVDKRWLDRVKDFNLSWKTDPGIKRPFLFATRRDIESRRKEGSPPSELVDLARVLARGHEVPKTPEWGDAVALAAALYKGDRASAEQLLVVERLRHHLSLLGNYDGMRVLLVVASLYDGLIDSDLISPRDRELFRAQMAYLAYRLEDPGMWSLDRGYNSGNPNMSISYILGLGIVACALADHPRAQHWIHSAIERFEFWLENDVGPKGEWNEGAHYDHVTVSLFVSFALAARNAGFHDFTRHPKFPLLVEFQAKQYTPPDPTRGGFRVLPPLGRANAGDRVGLVGVTASIMREQSPDYAAEMQWMWHQLGATYKIFDSRFGGMEYLLIDPRWKGRQPAWKSEHFPLTGAVLRHAFGSESEHYLSLATHENGYAIRPPEAGAVLKWFAYGKPIAGAFTGGYAERHELMMSRVMLARSPDVPHWNALGSYSGASRMRDFSSQPLVDYCDAEFTMEKPNAAFDAMPKGMPQMPPMDRDGKPPVSWRRQMLFVKSDAEAGPCYIVLRDTVRGGQPTMWHFWTMTNGVTSARQKGARENWPLNTSPEPAIKLEGSRFSARGQHGVDLEYFVAAPSDTPRYTLRWGCVYDHPVRDYAEYQDLVQLRLPGDGSYYVVMFPKRTGETTPLFLPRGDGQVIEVRGTFGKDLVFLGEKPIQAQIGEIQVNASAGCVQVRNGATTVALATGGTVSVGSSVVESTGPITRRFEDGLSRP
jgi:hypothetical protein